MDNRKRLLWAGFTAIFAAGIGFAIRGGIFDNWGAEYGFTGGELGAIGGAGFTGFCFGIIIGGVVADKIGYGWLVVAAFAFHVLSAVVTFMPTAGMDKSQAFNYLSWGMFLFAIANGTLEAVANPLVATLFPENRTHYLNILHASWPLGLIFGSAIGWVLDDRMQVGWKIQLALYLIPTVIYGVMFFGQHMPKSEASKKGLSLGEMLKDVGLLGGLVICLLLAKFLGGLLGGLLGEDTGGYVGYGIGGVLLIAIGVLTQFSLGSVLLFVLFVTHALVGAVELGTDGWIQNITGTIFTSETGKFLFVLASLVMFGLRFCAHFIEKNAGLSPVTLLAVCAITACVGLNLTSGADTVTMAAIAAVVYAAGKTFFWPTMLAVASDRFPRTGAIAISIMGGIGMMSAGLIGSQGLGYGKDRFAGEALKEADPKVYEEYKAKDESKFLVFAPSHGIDGKKLGAVNEKLAGIRKADPAAEKDAKVALAKLEPSERVALESEIKGNRKLLVADSVIPATMALIYILIALYFKTIGGYKPINIEEEEALEKKDELAAAKA